MTTKRELPFDLTMEHSRPALAEFDAGSLARENQLRACRTDRDVKKWEAAEEAALHKVREAFYLDTKDRNTHDNCMLVGITFIRRMVERADEERAKHG